MSSDMIFDAMDFIDDDMLEAVDALRLRQRVKPERRWLRYASAAACLLIIAGGVTAAGQYFLGDGAENTDGAYIEALPDGMNGFPGAGEYMGATDMEASGVTIPRTEIADSSSAISDMLGFFIYGGRMYVFYETVYGHTELVGEYLGHADATIDEWTGADGYVDFSGSISGDFYTVRGFDPSFMLCMKHSDGAVSTYINDNGFSLKFGSDLFEERLHLARNYSKVEYQTRKDWYYSQGNVKTLYSQQNSASSAVIEKFIEGLNLGEFIYTDDVPLGKGEKRIYDREIFHLIFEMNNGMSVHLRLYDGGYVLYDGLGSVCVKMDDSAFSELVDILK